MASILQTPFNYQPSTIARGLNTSYTVPSGKYAIVQFMVSATAYVSSGNASVANGGNGLWVTTDNCNLSFPIYLRAGDTIIATKSNASGTSNYSNSVGVATGATTITLSVNGTAVITFRARCSAYNHSVGGAGSTTLGGESDYGFIAHEYAI